MSVENAPASSRHYGSEYECPVCYEPLLPSIFQCFNGHLICNECIKKVSKCPVCRDGLPEKSIRALAVEKIILSTIIPCQFSDDGCKELLINSQSAEMHQLDCSYAALKYCSLMGLKCEKKVRKAELLDHFLLDHEGIYSPDYKYGDKLEISEDIVMNFGENGGEGERKTMALALIHTTDQTFVLKCAESQNEKVVTWKVLVLGSEALAREFSASIKIIPTAPLTVNNNSTTVLKWKGSILPIKSKLACLQAAQPHLLSVPYKYFPNLFSFGSENEKVKWRIRLKIRKTLVREPMVHFQVTCDSCNDETYISGPRYKCITCSNYDLCGKCMKKGIHAHHFFVVVVRPNSQIHAVLKSRDSIASALGVDPLENHLSVCNGDCMNYYLLAGYREHIAGVRFKCIECPDYDLCESCMRNQIHSHHLFVIIRNQGMRDQLRNVLSL